MADLVTLTTNSLQEIGPNAFANGPQRPVGEFGQKGGE